MKTPWILGYSASHNGAVCLLHGEELVCAIQEERLTGEKRARIDRLEDSLALNYCLQTAGISVEQLDVISGCHFSGSPVLGCGIQRQGWRGRQMTIPHHLGHAIGAYAQSGFEKSAILVIDGAGGTTQHLPAAEKARLIPSGYPTDEKSAEIASLYLADGRQLTCIEKHSGMWVSKQDRDRKLGMPAFGSLGGMYASAAHQIFGDPNDAGKVMGLAASGVVSIPEHEFFQVRADGGLDFTAAVCKRFQNNHRWPDNQEQLSDLAASVQAALETGVNHLADRLLHLTEAENLTYCGGVALNCVANEILIQRGLFDDVYIAPAAEDSGPAVGAAYFGLWQCGVDHPVQRYNHDSLGGRYTSTSLAKAVVATPGIQQDASSDNKQQILDALCSGEIVGWFSGGSELGPRALGHRSILADARSPATKQRLNASVKRRESFRPFAPLVLAEKVDEWFETPVHIPDSPLMLRSFRFKPEMAERVPSAVHRDGTGRLQTLTEDANPDLYGLLRTYYEQTGVPILINTSFNVMGEPIVETPQDALWCLAFTDIDCLMLQDRIVRKKDGFDFLDLVPRVLPVTWTLESPTLNDLRNSSVQLAIPTPWGRLRMPNVNLLLPVMSMIEKGRFSVRQIVQAMREDNDFEPATTLTSIYLLRRKGVIALAMADSSGQGAAAPAV